MSKHHRQQQQQQQVNHNSSAPENDPIRLDPESVVPSVVPPIRLPVAPAEEPVTSLPEQYEYWQVNNVPVERISDEANLKAREGYRLTNVQKDFRDPSKNNMYILVFERNNK